MHLHKSGDLSQQSVQLRESIWPSNGGDKHLIPGFKPSDGHDVCRRGHRYITVSGGEIRSERIIGSNANVTREVTIIGELLVELPFGVTGPVRYDVLERAGVSRLHQNDRGDRGDRDHIFENDLSTLQSGADLNGAMHCSNKQEDTGKIVIMKSQGELRGVSNREV